MDPIRILFSRCAALFHRRQLDVDLDEELQAHIGLATEENLKRGMSEAAARRAALREFGGVTQTRESYREQRGVPFLESLQMDVRFALRQLRKSPVFAATVVLTVALSIGANTAIFSVVQGVVLAPLPYAQPDRLAVVHTSRPGLSRMGTSYPDFRDWERSAHSFEQVAALTWRNYDLTGSGAPAHLDGMAVSSGLFATLGVKLALGREFSSSEDMPHGSPAVIISDRLWRDRFGSSPQAVGRAMVLDGVETTIQGVLPPGFRIWNDADVYTPLGQREPLLYNDRTIHGIVAIGRLKPNVSIGQAQAELRSIQENLDRIYPAADRNLGLDIAPLKDLIVGDAGGTLFLLLGAVGIVPLIACINVANLLLARAAARTREFAIRSALGANRSRIVRQLLTESVLLALTGGVLGLIVAKLGVSLLLAKFPNTLPRADNIGVNLPVLLFAAGISIAVGILFGLAPALKSARADVQDSLKAGDRGSTRAHPRAQSALVIVQMAMALVLLVAAGLLLRTVRHLWEVNPGFNRLNVITFRVGLSPSLTKSVSSTRLAYQQLVERIRQVPGVEAADFTNIVPLSEHDNGGPFWVGPQQSTSMQDAPHALYFETGPDYLQTMEIPLLRGRYFAPSDTAASEPVVVIDSVLARTYFPDQDPVGQTITVAHWRTARIIGVVGHVSHWGLNDPGTYNPSQIYISFYQLSDAWVPAFARELSVAVRTPLDVATIMPAIRDVAYGVAQDQPVFDIQTMRQIASDSMATQRLPMMLLGAFAVLAMLLASVGIYGVMSYAVAQRVPEIGIRMALGARRSDVQRMVIGQGLRLAVVGVAIGGAVALGLTRLLTSFSHLLYGVRGSDPLTFMTVSCILVCAALLACCVPARRAASTDPMRALRTE